MILVWCHRLAICSTISLHFPLINMPISIADSSFYNWEIQRSQQTRSQGQMKQQRKKDAIKERCVFVIFSFPSSDDYCPTLVSYSAHTQYCCPMISVHLIRSMKACQTLKLYARSDLNFHGIILEQRRITPDCSSESVRASEKVVFLSIGCWKIGKKVVTFLRQVLAPKLEQKWKMFWLKSFFSPLAGGKFTYFNKLELFLN